MRTKSHPLEGLDLSRSLLKRHPMQRDQPMTTTWSAMITTTPLPSAASPAVVSLLPASLLWLRSPPWPEPKSAPSPHPHPLFWSPPRRTSPRPPQPLKRVKLRSPRSNQTASFWRSPHRTSRMTAARMGSICCQLSLKRIPAQSQPRQKRKAPLEVPTAMRARKTVADPVAEGTLEMAMGTTA